MNRKLLLSALICAATGNAVAASIVTPGATVTTGPTSDGNSIYSATFNPAVAAVTIDKGEKWRFGYGSFSFSTEIGDVNNFVDEVDDLIDILDDPSKTTDSVEATRTRFNNILVQLGKEGYLKSSTQTTIPAFPIAWHPDFLPGTLFGEVSLGAQARVSLLDEELEFDPVKQSFGTSSSVYLKSGIQTDFALGYAQEILQKNPLLTDHGHLFAGVKANIYKLELSKQVLWLQQLEGKGIKDYVKDAYDEHLKSTTNLGLDLGVTWVAASYRAGLTIKNLNSPSFSYGDIGVNCDQYADATFEKQNCLAARHFIFPDGRIKSHENHIKHATGTVDGTYYIFSNWAISSSVDLAAYDDIVGTENQWFTASTSINTVSTWIPDVRLGYHKNLAGSEISTVAFGLSFFDTVTLDTEMALDDIKVDGNSAPRKVAFSIAIEEKF